MNMPLGLFEGYGIELEYMIVKKDSLDVAPITDEVMKMVAGEFVSDVEDGAITWSNELVLHVIELKTSGPARTLNGLESEFHRSVRRINGLLGDLNARLLPTAMHPWMNPSTDTKLWPHDNNEIYESYNRIFDCRGHGWSNLQSMHINLPFRDDREFARLHTAIRLILPILPALTSSSPVVEGRVLATKDNRLKFYQQNQRRVPSIAGLVIPEPVLSEKEYRDKILGRIFSDIAPFDPEEMLRDDWLNSRGAITRFGRQTIEIRVLDTQECPSADLALADLICAVVKRLVSGDVSTMEEQLSLETQELKRIFDTVVENAEDSVIDNVHFLEALGIDNKGPRSANEIWTSLLSASSQHGMMADSHRRTAERILSQGSLSSRIQRKLGQNPTRTELFETYSQLAECLQSNELFEANRR